MGEGVWATNIDAAFPQTFPSIAKRPDWPPKPNALYFFLLILGSLQIQGLLARLGGWDVIRWTKAYESIWGEAQGR